MFMPELGLFGISQFKTILLGLLFTNATLKPERDFLSSALSGERVSLLLLTFPLFPEWKQEKWRHWARKFFQKGQEIVKCGFWCKLPLLPLLWHANAVDEN